MKPSFAAKVDRRTVHTGCEHLGITVEEHAASVVRFLAPLG